jgi:hypothetical protein
MPSPSAISNQSCSSSGDAGRGTRRARVGLLVLVAGEQFNDLRHAGGGLIELAAHLGEPGVNVLFEPVEAGSGLHAERVDRGPVGVDLDAEVGRRPLRLRPGQ